MGTFDAAIDELLARRAGRPPSPAIDVPTVDAWCAAFGSDWPERRVDVLPGIAFTTFVRPVAPPASGAAAPTGVVLHDEVKRVLDLPVAIAVGYELELQGPARVGDVLRSEERVATIGAERETRFGPGREWVIEVATSSAAGPVGIERFRMLGYRPGASSSSSTPATGRGDEEVAVSWTDRLSLGRDDIIRLATANRVWAAAHHRRDEAIAFGLPDIILDTSSHVALWAGAAQRRRPDRPIASVELEMRRPILPDVAVDVVGIDHVDEVEIDVEVVASVDGRVASRASVHFAS